MNWTTEQLTYVEANKTDEISWNQMSRMMENQFGVKRTGNNISTRMRQFNKDSENKMDKKRYEPATKRQCRYYAGLTLNLDATTEMKSEMTEAYYVLALDGKLSKSLASEQIKLLEAHRNSIKPNRKVISSNKMWSKEEDELLMFNYQDSSDLDEVSSMLSNRSRTAIQQRFWRLKKLVDDADLDEKVVEILSELPETIEDSSIYNFDKDEGLIEVVDKKHERSRMAWKPNEEFDLICNFYELSIDEARATFKRSYASLAHRLELIVDSEQPEHLLMLKRAARFTNQRKKQAIKDAKQGYFKRRKLSRIAKRNLRKTTKVSKQTAKLEKKLNKLRGE